MPNSLDFSRLAFIRLTEDYLIKPFDCDDEDLNDFIFNAAKGYLIDLLAVTYLIEDLENNTTIAFFSLFNDRIGLKDTNNNKWNKIRKHLPKRKKLKSYPAVKLGRLGVSKEFKGKGYGTAILNYLKIHFITNNRTGCKFITVDAYGESLGFYERNGFNFLTDSDSALDTRQMYFDLKVL